MTVFENCAYRFIFGSAALLPILLRHKTVFPWRDLKLLLLTAVLGVPVQFLIQFKGLSLTTVSHASLMVGTAPVFLALSSALLLHERLTHFEWIVLALSAFGAMLVAASHDHGSTREHATVVGDLLVLASLLAAVAMILTSKRLIARYDPLHITAASIILGTILLLVFVELIEPVRHHFSSRVWISVAAQGVLATTLAYLFWNWGLARVPASRAGVFLNLEPVVGAILGVLILGDSLTILTVAGGALIIGSAIFFSRRTRATT